MNKRSKDVKTLSHAKGDRLPGKADGRFDMHFITDDDHKELFKKVGQYLREGRSAESERILTHAIDDLDLSSDELASIKRLLSFTLETTGRYRESLDVLTDYDTPDNFSLLSIDVMVSVRTQLAIAYNNMGDQPRAVTLLKEMLQIVEENNLTHLSGKVNVALARVYRRLTELPISRDYANSALEGFRSIGDWLGLAEAYREIAITYHQEGNSERSLDYFEHGIKIIGENSAPFMLGKLYSDMSGAYWFLRRPHDGVSCLEKSIEFFDQTEHALNSVIAYNNLGINLTHLGDWTKAEAMIRRALAIAEREDYTHVAGIYDSLGELMILRGDLDDAKDCLTTAVNIARERKNQWYEVQSMRNLARCFLAKGETSAALALAQETIKLCTIIGDKHYANMVGLTLAECYLELDNIDDLENALADIQDSTDFYVLGHIQRLQGIAAFKADDVELATHHLSRALTIFEAAEDMYDTGLMHLLLGTHLLHSDIERSRRHLLTADGIFSRLGSDALMTLVKDEMAKLEAFANENAGLNNEQRRNNVVSQLLTVRLAEATASRELLFRELIAVLQQESNAKKMLIAQYDDEKRLVPFISHGYAPQEMFDIVKRLSAAIDDRSEKAFSRTKDIALFPLKGSAAPSAHLIIYPRSGAVLNDGTSLQPLISVAELGMDVIALRGNDRTKPVEADANPYTASSLMPGFIHSSPAMTNLVEEVYKIRSSDVTVLITGESGTGKELVARAISTISNRKDNVFIPFNCTTLPKELAEGQLFGYKKGAYTGASQDSEGVIRSADGGTLFLDEIGDLPLDVQPKLLRFLQEGEIHPLGEKKPIKVDVRIIAATNVSLEEKVAAGLFREDLFFRLNVIRLRVPPLRERRSEIPPIVNYYINQYSSRFGKNNVTFMPQTIDMLMVCSWEGNVRQLCNEIQRIVARAVDNEVITPDHLSPELKRSAKPLTSSFDPSSNVRPIATYEKPIVPFANIAEGSTLEEAVSELEMQLIRASLTRNNWNISRVASELGLTRRGLYLKLSRYGIEKAA